MNHTAVIVPKLRFSEPRHNLPGRKGIATPEDHFTIAFMRAYLDQAAAIHYRSRKTKLAFAREIPVNGYGIADLCVVAWDQMPGEMFPDATSFIKVARPCTRAFECKLMDWRRAIAQANRYRFFANQAFVVLPEYACSRALVCIETFKMINLGLWSFSRDTGLITPHYTPRARHAISERYNLHVIESVAHASRQSLPIP